MSEAVLVLQRVSGSQGVQLQLVRATPQEAQQYKEEERQARLQAIEDAAGHCSSRNLASTRDLLPFPMFVCFVSSPAVYMCSCIRHCQMLYAALQDMASCCDQFHQTNCSRSGDTGRSDLPYLVAVYNI